MGRRPGVRYLGRVLDRLLRHCSLAALVGAAALAGPTPALADSLIVDPQINSERGYSPVEELSYEWIVEGMVGMRADLRIRVALHNTSARAQDAVLSLALPRGAELHGLRVARGGAWSNGKMTDLVDEPGRRDPGAIFARWLPPAELGDLPGAEVVAFSLDPGSTTQIEVRALVPPAMRGDRWELVAPERGESPLGLVRDRRVMVTREGDAARFWVDGGANDGAPFVLTKASERVTVGWPVTQPQARAGARLSAHMEAQRGRGGEAGDFRLYLRLAASEPVRPDHVIAVIDRSRSTAPEMHREIVAALSALFDALPAETTFDAISFARRPRALMTATRPPSVRDEAARRQLAIELDAGTREQGTDLAAALALAGERLRTSGARRPVILVFSDGMLPASIPPQAVEAALAGALGGRRASWPEVIFVVDEPMLARRGLRPDHPVATMAAALGARISLETVAQRGQEARELLAAPRVLSELAIDLPRGATLTSPAPSGLIAGNVVALEGRFEGSRPPQVRVRGRQGARKIAVAPTVAELSPPPSAWVASVGAASVEALASDGYAAPPWLTRYHQRLARLSIMWAGRGGQLDRGHLDERIFRRYLLTRVFPRARACYNAALTRDQTLSGRVSFEIEVGKGEVMHAMIASQSMSRSDPIFEACILEAAWALEVPAGQLDEATYRLGYPVAFNAPAGGKPPVEGDPLGAGTVELLLSAPAPEPRAEPSRRAPTRER
jgi:Mg-chelatase subunit ChlD